MHVEVAGDALGRHRAAVRRRLLRAHHARPGPGSITWRIHREVIVTAGWGRAVLLQLAHPAVAAGVDHHSTFRGSLGASYRRMRSTVGSMLSLTFGDSEEAIADAARINAIHDRVRGAAYSAHDPELQQWVHATLLQSTLLAYELLVGPLDVQEKDRYCAEAAVMEPLLGVPTGRLPRDFGQLEAYVEAMLASEGIQVTETARVLARAVLFPPRWSLVWPAFRAMQVVTLGTLPPSLREAFGIAWGARDVRAFRRWTRALRASRRMLPRLAREWPRARRVPA